REDAKTQRQIDIPPLCHPEGTQSLRVEKCMRYFRRVVLVAPAPLARRQTIGLVRMKMRRMCVPIVRQPGLLPALRVRRAPGHWSAGAEDFADTLDQIRADPAQCALPSRRRSMCHDRLLSGWNVRTFNVGTFQSSTISSRCTTSGP